MPRGIIPCKWERKAINRVHISLRLFQTERAAAGHVDDDSVGKHDDKIVPQDCVGRDVMRICQHCNTLLFSAGQVRSCNTTGREVKLHTIIYGTTWVQLNDLICLSCEHTTVYDGHDDGIFSYSYTTALSRELIDYWLYAVVLLG